LLGVMVTDGVPDLEGVADGVPKLLGVVVTEGVIVTEGVTEGLLDLVDVIVPVGVLVNVGVGVDVNVDIEVPEFVDVSLLLLVEVNVEIPVLVFVLVYVWILDAVLVYADVPLLESVLLDVNVDISLADPVLVFVVVDVWILDPVLVFADVPLLESVFVLLNKEVKDPILLEVPDWEIEILDDEDPNVVSVDIGEDELDILVVPLSDIVKYPVEVEISLIEIVSLDVRLVDGEFDIVLMLVWVFVLSEVKSPLFVLLPPLVILELSDCILLSEDDEEDDKLCVSVKLGDLDILYVNVPTGDNVIVDLIVFVEVFVINGEFVTEKLLLDVDVTDDDLECILLVFVGEFVDDDVVRVDLDVETDPVDVLE
jgi:hypothetical protein